MKKLLFITALSFTVLTVQSQSISDNLPGVYYSNSDWVKLNSNGTGSLYVTNSLLPLGNFSFNWTSNDDQVTIRYIHPEYGYEEMKWCYYYKRDGVLKLEFPTMSYGVIFKKR
jgi:hypothetical protein